MSKSIKSSNKIWKHWTRILSYNENWDLVEDLNIELKCHTVPDGLNKTLVLSVNVGTPTSSGYRTGTLQKQDDSQVWPSEDNKELWSLWGLDVFGSGHTYCMLIQGNDPWPTHAGVQSLRGVNHSQVIETGWLWSQCWMVDVFETKTFHGLLIELFQDYI